VGTVRMGSAPPSPTMRDLIWTDVSGVVAAHGVHVCVPLQRIMCPHRTVCSTSFICDRRRLADCKIDHVDRSVAHVGPYGAGCRVGGGCEKN
jgi:hypothetical protein